jgi:hypothetical protein
MDVELLHVGRTAEFIQHCLVHDLQVKVNRSTASSLLHSAIACPRETEVIRFGSEKFDKMATYFNSNDQQVHYASAANSVGTYAITRLLGELRRTVRDYQPVSRSQGNFLPMMSPRVFAASEPRPAQQGVAEGSGFQLVPGSELRERTRAAGREAGGQDTERSNVSGEGLLT